MRIKPACRPMHTPYLCTGHEPTCARVLVVLPAQYPPFHCETGFYLRTTHPFLFLWRRSTYLRSAVNLDIKLTKYVHAVSLLLCCPSPPIKCVPDPIYISINIFHSIYDVFHQSNQSAKIVDIDLPHRPYCLENRSTDDSLYTNGTVNDVREWVSRDRPVKTVEFRRQLIDGETVRSVHHSKSNGVP